MGNVERSADLVVAICFAILRQFGFDLDPGNTEKVADGVLILVSVEAAQSGAAALRIHRSFVPGESRGQTFHKLSRCFRGRPGNASGGHFACRDAVVDFDPKGEVVGVSWFEASFREIQTAGGGGRVVASDAILLDEGFSARERWGGFEPAGDKTCSCSQEGRNYRVPSHQYRNLSES